MVPSKLNILYLLKNYDFILCNVKGPDVAGHDGNIKGKIEIIEKIDVMIVMDIIITVFII